MNDHELEKNLRSLRPAPLPSEVRARLKEEPAIQPRRHHRRNLGFAIAAVLVAAATLVALLTPKQSDPAMAREEDTHYSVVQQEAVLLSSRTLETREHNGQLWELVEIQWREDTVSICTATTATVRATEIRPERVWVPVQYY